MVGQRIRSMDEELGYALGSNTVLARSADHHAAIVLRALIAFTGGYEVEIVFMSREPGSTTEYERWDNLDTEAGPQLGFTYTEAMPSLHSPRTGAWTEGQPPWHPSALWGGAGGDETRKVVARNLRARLLDPAPSQMLTIGWSWVARGITADSRAFEVPRAEDVERFTASIWDET